MSNSIVTSTVFCDGSLSFDKVDQGKYQLGVELQLFSLAIIFGICFYFYITYPKRISKFSDWRFDLFRFKTFEKIVRFKYFSFFVRLIPAALFILVLITGIWGRDRTSLAAPFVWMFWWTLLIFFVAFFGKIFCALCPWDFFANLFQFGAVFKRSRNKSKKLLPWPKKLSNINIAIVFFIILTWLELGFEITKSSYWTAVLGLFVGLCAIVIPMFFEKRAFCRYACPVGRISGLYSLFAPVELRVKDSSVCGTCKGKECVKGNEFSTACPTGLIPFKLSENTYCTLCTECVRSCDKSNLTLKIRPFASDISDKKRKFHKDESLLAIVMFVLTYFHGITMVYPWFQMVDKLRNQFDLNYTWAFSILMAAGLLICALIYKLLDLLVRYITKSKISFSQVAFCFIPLTLAYHLGHNVMHLFGELPFITPMLNDPFGVGANIFGLKGNTPQALFEHADMVPYQVLLIVIGFYYSSKSLKILLSGILEKEEDAVLRYQFLYFVAGSILLTTTIFSYWLISSPMVVRGGL